MPVKQRLALSFVGGVATLAAASFFMAGPGSFPDARPTAHHHGASVHMQAAAPPGAGAEVKRPATIVKPVSCEKLPHVPGKSVTTAVVEFPPNARTPAHRHPGSVTAFVLEGAIRSQLSGGPIAIYKAGDTWFEPPGTLHLFAENASHTAPAELLAIFIADDDCGPLVVYER